MNSSSRIISILSFTLFVVLLFIFFVSLAMRYRKRKKESEVLKAHYSLELQKVRTEIKEQTLQYISRELHDNLGQSASLIKIYLNTIDMNLLPPEAFRNIDSARILMRRLTQDIKLLSVGLTNRDAYRPFLQVVQNEIDQLNKTGIFTALLEVSDDFIEPQEEKGLVVYRMVQEVINNVLRHSQATAIRVHCICRNGVSVIGLHDNGTGFDTRRQPSAGSSGLRNLRSRARLIHAELEIESSKASGTTVTIVLHPTINQP